MVLNFKAQKFVYKNFLYPPPPSAPPPAEDSVNERQKRIDRENSDRCSSKRDPTNLRLRRTVIVFAFLATGRQDSIDGIVIRV